MRKVDKTITLPIYYSLYHDKNLTVKTLFYAQLLYEIISLQKFAMSNINKERQFTYSYPVFLYFFFYQRPRSLIVPDTVSCARILGVFIDNRSKNVPNQYSVFF